MYLFILPFTRIKLRTHLLIFGAGDFLEEGGWVFAVGKLEALVGEEGHHIFPGPMKDDMPCSQCRTTHRIRVTSCMAAAMREAHSCSCKQGFLCVLMWVYPGPHNCDQFLLFAPHGPPPLLRLLTQVCQQWDCWQRSTALSSALICHFGCQTGDLHIKTLELGSQGQSFHVLCEHMTLQPSRQ